MSNFGELNFESSRAFADDEDEDISDTSFGLTIELTEEGKKYSPEVSNGSGSILTFEWIGKGKENEVSKGSHVFCAFVGKVSLGFGEGFLKTIGDFSLLGQIFMTGNEGTIDLCSVRPKRKPSVRIYRGGKTNPVIFALIDFYGVPRFLSNELTEKLSGFINASSKVILFHSETSAYSRGDDEVEGKLFYLTTSFAQEVSLKGANRLPPPNIVSGPSASILTYCEMKKKSGLLLITYSETESVDSISMKPFFQAVSTESQGPSSDFNLEKIFSQFQHNIRKSAGTTSSSSSNLYV